MKDDDTDTRVFRIILDYIFISLFLPSLEKNFCLQMEAYLITWLTFGFPIIVMKTFSKLVSFHLHIRVTRTNSTSFSIPGP